MISCAVLERPGLWRVVGIIAVTAVAFAPALALVASRSTTGAELDAAFFRALGRSLEVAALVSLLSFCAGLPLGVLTALYDFPLRRLLLSLIALPLLAPSFLWAVGLSELRAASGVGGAIFHGRPGVVFVFSSLVFPLVVLMSLAASGTISRSADDAARLAGGDLHLFRCVLGSVWPAAALTAVLGGVLTLSDPGPDQIFGFGGVASEILTSFAAQYDFALAARQCLTLAAVVLVLALPAAMLLSSKLAAAVLARDTIRAPTHRTHPTRWLGPLTLAVVVLLTTGLPLVGLLIPLNRGLSLQRAWHELARTTSNTLFYSSTAAVIAVGLGLTLAICAGRSRRLRGAVFVCTLVLLALPPSLGALGLIRTGAIAPPMFDSIFRSRLTVSLNAATRCVPIAAIFAMRAVGTTSPSWANAAALHGLALPRYLFTVLLPWVAPALVVAGVVSALISTADITSVLLLHPPGEASFPLAIFTLMVNAPESLVSTLCLLYISAGAALLIAGLSLARVAGRK